MPRRGALTAGSGRARSVGYGRRRFRPVGATHPVPLRPAAHSCFRCSRQDGAPEWHRQRNGDYTIRAGPRAPRACARRRRRSPRPGARGPAQPAGRARQAAVGKLRGRWLQAACSRTHARYWSGMREEAPTALNMRSYQPPIWEFCGGGDEGGARAAACCCWGRLLRRGAAGGGGRADGRAGQQRAAPQAPAGTRPCMPRPGTPEAAAPSQRIPQPTCMRSLKVSVPVTARTTPNTARSARSGWEPPRKGRPPSAPTHSSADCGGAQAGAWREVEGHGREQGGGRAGEGCTPHRSRCWPPASRNPPPARLAQLLPHVALHPVLLLQLAAQAPHQRGAHQPRCGRRRRRRAAEHAVRRRCGGKRAPCWAPAAGGCAPELELPTHARTPAQPPALGITAPAGQHAAGGGAGCHAPASRDTQPKLPAWLM